MPREWHRYVILWQLKELSLCLPQHHNRKVQQVQMFGREHVEIRLVGDTYDASYQVAREFSETNQLNFVHPFDDAGDY